MFKFDKVESTYFQQDKKKRHIGRAIVETVACYGH